MPTIISGDTGIDKIAAGAIEKSDLPAGSVLQVVQTVKTDTFSTTSTTFIDVTGLSVTITPSSASNKILVFCDVMLSYISGGSTVRLLRNSTPIYVGDAAGSRPLGLIETPDGTFYGGIRSGGIFLDSPATTSAVTYKIQMLTTISGVINRTGRDENNSAYDPRTASSITVMEISG
jgi:hypothetical protein